MTVSLPPDMAPALRASTLAAEKKYARKVQETGERLHLWRCASLYANRMFEKTRSRSGLPSGAMRAEGAARGDREPSTGTGTDSRPDVRPPPRELAEELCQPPFP